MYEIRKATLEDLEAIWDRNIRENPGDGAWIRWKKQFIGYNQTGMGTTFVVLCDGEPVGEGTLLHSPECKAIRGRLELADGKSASNINALRIFKEHEGKGWISRLVKLMEDHARDKGCRTVTIGVEAAQTRNLGIYLHWGYDHFLFSEEEDGELVLYYAKDLN